MITEFKMPKMGESISEATIISWLKNVGDFVEAEETILEVATDKVDSDVPTPVSGVITEIRFQKDDVVEVGTVLALIEVVGNEVVGSRKEVVGSREEVVEFPTTQHLQPNTYNLYKPINHFNCTKRKPFVRRIANHSRFRSRRKITKKRCVQLFKKSEISFKKHSSTYNPKPTTYNLSQAKNQFRRRKR